MKIIHTITTINRGGAENHLSDLVTGQISMGHSVTICYLKGDGYWADYYNSIGVKTKKLSFGIIGFIIGSLQLRKLIKTQSPDVLHAHLPPAELLSYLSILLFRPKIKFIISRHVDSMFFGGSRGKEVGFFSRHFAKHILNSCDRLICISNAVKNYIGNHIAINLEKVHVVYYGIEINKFKFSPNDRMSIRAQYQIPEDSCFIGCIARLEKQKNLHILLDAFSQLIHTTHMSVNLMIVGKGSLDKELKKMAKEYNIDTSVIFVPYREDTPSVFSAFDIFVLPSKYEGLGLVLLEALSVGLPILSTNTSAIPEIITKEVCGKLVPVDNPGAIFKGILEFINCGYSAHKHDCNRQYVETNFSNKSMLEKIEHIYNF